MEQIQQRKGYLRGEKKVLGGEKGSGCKLRQVIGSTNSERKTKVNLLGEIWDLRTGWRRQESGGGRKVDEAGGGMKERMKALERISRA